MALVGIYKHNNSVAFLAKDEAQARQVINNSFSSFEDNSQGILFTVPDADFVNLQKGHKEISYNGTNYVIADLGTEFYMTGSKESLTTALEVTKERLKFALMKHKDNSFHSEIVAYKQAIDSVNVDNLTYPLGKTLNQHLLDEGFTTVLHPLQLI